MAPPKLDIAFWNYDRARSLAASRVEWTVDFPKVSKRVRWMARDLDDSRPAAAMEANRARGCPLALARRDSISEER